LTGENFTPVNTNSCNEP